MICAICGRAAKHIWWETFWVCGTSDGKSGCARMWHDSPEWARAQEQINSGQIPDGPWREKKFGPPFADHHHPYVQFDAVVPQLRAFVERLQASGWRRKSKP